jgi:hypothetical protein
MFTGANNIFLGKLSVRSQCLYLLQTLIDPNKSIFRARECLNKEFPSKFLYAVDLHYQIWLKQRRIPTNCSDINDTIINFSQLVSQVLFGSFYISLPPTFSIKTPEATATNGKNHSNCIGADKEMDAKVKKEKPTKLKSSSKTKLPTLTFACLPTKYLQ